MDEIKDQITKKVSAMSDEIIGFLQSLVRTPSLPDNEGPVQEIIFNKLRSLGLEVEKVPVLFNQLRDHPAFCDDGYSADSRFNVVGQWNHDREKRSLILNGHVDVVPTGEENLWNEYPWSGLIKNGLVYGRGACDMKAGLSAAIFAVQVLQNMDIKPAGNIMIQSVVGEETGGCGTLANIVRGFTADAAVILEPTSLKVCPIQSGALTFRLTIKGKATHAAQKWDGVSALEKFSLIYQGLMEWEMERHGQFRTKYFPSNNRVAPINIGTVRSGKWHSTVPDSLVAEGRLGVFPDESVQAARNAFELFVNTLSDLDEWLKHNPPDIEWIEGQFESGKTDPNHPVIQSLCNSYLVTTGKKAIVEGVTYGSDLRLFTNYAKIPAVLFGPGELKHAHAANENVSVEDVLTTVKVLANLILNWCKTIE